MNASHDRVLRVAARLTDRDIQLLEWLDEHRVLTTQQIANALFDGLRIAQRRMLALTELEIVDRFRIYLPGGGRSGWRYVLGLVGAQFVAARRGDVEPRAAAVQARKRAIAASRGLAHQLGVNQFFTDLAGHGRRHGDGELLRWWSAERMMQPGVFGPGVVSPVRPDGHGIWAQDGRSVAFVLEYDRGTESHTVLDAKLDAYEGHLRAGGPAWPVLFWFPSIERERHFHDLLSRRSYPLTVATYVADGQDGTGPADAVWLVHGAVDAPRRLIDLLVDVAPVPGGASER